MHMYVSGQREHGGIGDEGWVEEVGRPKNNI